MTVKTLLALGALSSLALATAASAQAAAPAAAPASSGPVIPGVCTYFAERAVGTSAVGKSFQDRMRQLVSAVQAELQADQTSLESEQNRLRALSKEQIQAQAPGFQQKVAAFEQKRNQRSQELQSTQQRQLQKIATELDPILQQVYTERGCGIMFERSQLVGASQGMDVTDLVVQRLNAKVSALPAFDRDHLDQQQAAAAPAAAAPAPAATHKKK